jgi:predicted AAA+ superfamily ATPase
MKIERKNITEKLQQWKNSINRKPLILQGARQVGKTWILKEFGRANFESVAYFNFEAKPELKQFFATTKDPQRIIENLSLVHGEKITADKTFIIFDEIQESNEALNSLKYFCEEAPQYYIAAAGSLLGVAMNRGNSFPVGKVDFLNLYPASFSEFLSVCDRNLASYLEGLDNVEQIPDIFFNPLVEKFKMYLISGGLPEAITSLLSEGGTNQCQITLQNTINAYKLDFSKYVENRDIQKLNYIWDSLPSQLARENKKFLYQTVKPGARARDYEDALLWLINSGLVHRIYRNEKPALPLSAYDDLSAFKVYSLDVGILRRMSNLDPGAIVEGNRLLTEFKGALTENFVLQSLTSQFETQPRYWSSGNKAEVDFILQYNNQIIPIEVKAGENVRSKSLAFYRMDYKPELSIRYSLKNLSFADGLLSMPLFLIDYTEKFIRKIMQ